MATKRVCKLQEFVAHASNVNCVKFGRRTSRILITGGEDLKVNLWAVGKPSALLSLSGLTSPVESVSFDSSEVTIGAGAASGTIKIWDVEEAKVVRTFTGHRSNCASLEFHPFGEFLASGSSDTNMKIWDIRKKRCIHTYKGHTRRIDVLKFTPDGRWIVSGGADNSVKIWDLTAGKLLHDFSLHEGPVNCLDFHPHEFLLATGSADKTVKFWDLETFELIGSSGPENSREYLVPASVVRSMKFNSDGKTLFCGLHESLKVLSWEPIICHDMVDVGWSTLADITVDEGKLLGCSYNQSCVGVWVVDLMRIEPRAGSSAGSQLNGSVDSPIQSDNSISSVFGRLSVSRSPASEIASDTMLERSMSASKEIPISASSALIKRLSKPPGTRDLRLTRSDSVPLLSPRVRLNPNSVVDQKRQPAAVVPLPAPRVRSKEVLSSDAGMLSHNSHASAVTTYRSRSNISACGSKESSFMPILVARHSSKVDAGPILSEAATGEIPTIEPRNVEKGGLAANHGKEDGKLVPMIDSKSSKMDVEGGCRRITDDVKTSLGVNLDFDYRRRAPESQKVHEHIFQSKPISSQRKFTRETSGSGENNCSGSVCTESVKSNEVGSWYDVPRFEKRKSASTRNPEFANINRTAVLGLSQLESSGRHAIERRPSSSNYDIIQSERTVDSSRRCPLLARKECVSTSDEDVMADLMENHQEFIHAMKSRLTKLEVVYRCWQRNDLKGVLDATWRILDYAVTADIISILMENSNCITLDTCTFLLRLASCLLESTYDRHLSIALEMVLSLVKSFGATISSTLSATPPVGVDLEAEQRLERCNLCFQELKKVSGSLKSLTRRQGEVGRTAQELSLFLQDIFQLSSV
ncbi:katanin p80 WD40 repeat-containing subunit B1 homolog KTN80.4-like isoform X2 [Phragmites australis]|uniref:katanin p80 WD40 repeat-containing subunit B1 homolog KTN80.4-like isoform X2 n=1 Tax=Phragmites australis TaxID=29695 RepID=UPI002D79987A|nr:katanin p80 WD40 repeat-containing subunit B1 homolog KTN80.4-like isoform X2 [Phragmites australis]